MPDHPIYIPLLPYSAQAVIGQVQPETMPALTMLEDEGFTRSGVVDIFDAGPVVQCPLNQIRCVRQSKVDTVTEIGPVETANSPMIVAVTGKDFRATLAMVVTVDGGVRIDANVAAALGVTTGGRIRYVSPKPAPENHGHDAPGSI
jgi:arginine N-succinyltransferase